MSARFATPGLALIAALLLLPACSALERATGEENEPPPEEGDEPREPRTVQGFRIQILTTGDKSAADQRAAEAESTWGLPVEVAWKAPYYRVRVGAFASRDAAQGDLETVQQQYPDAFLVPDTVTIRPD
jgi:cell division septation protein DedD